MGKVKLKLPRGTAAKIAKQLKLSHNHVNLVIKGERNGSPRLLKAIEAERDAA